MSRSILTNYFFAPLLAVTFVIVWIGFSSPVQSTPPEQSTEPAQHAQSVPVDFNPKSVVKLVHHGPDHPPVVSSPFDDRSRVVLFPGGPGAILEFEGEPATDYEEDLLTYRFGIAIPGKLGIRSPEEALLQITRDGNRFLILPHGNVAPSEFASVYGNTGTVPVLPAVIYASDGKSESKPEFFNLTLVYDASTRHSAPSESMGEYPGLTPDPAHRSEEVLDSEDGTYTHLIKVADESRVWRLDPPSLFTGTVRTIQTAR